KPNAVGAPPKAPCKPVSTRLAGRSAEARVAQYLLTKQDPSIAEVADATGLTEHRIRRTQSWKDHEERRLGAFLHDHPQADTGDVKNAFGFSASKTVGMRAWTEHQARRAAAKPPQRVKEVSLSQKMLHCRPDPTVVDPAARVADRDELFHTIE